VVAKITQGMGFDYCCYGIRMPIPVSGQQYGYSIIIPVAG